MAAVMQWANGLFMPPLYVSAVALSAAVVLQLRKDRVERDQARKAFQHQQQERLK